MIFFCPLTILKCIYKNVVHFECYVRSRYSVLKLIFTHVCLHLHPVIIQPEHCAVISVCVSLVLLFSSEPIAGEPQAVFLHLQQRLLQEHLHGKSRGA